MLSLDPVTGLLKLLNDNTGTGTVTAELIDCTEL
jgi:hypothetical protein